MANRARFIKPGFKLIIEDEQNFGNIYSTAVRGMASSQSSHLWLERQRKDIYKKMSRYHNYRARSAYKLIQIDDKFKFLKPGIVVIEAGAAPGSWTQVICERLKLDEETAKNPNHDGMCLALDIAAIEPVPGAICLGNTDFTSPFTQGKILTWLDGRKADCVLSDMAPSATGHKFLNHEKVMRLLYSLMPFAFRVLKQGTGVFLAKLWDGDEREPYMEKLKLYFNYVKIVKPDASRDDSAEMYIFCRGFKGDAVWNEEIVIKK